MWFLYWQIAESSLYSVLKTKKCRRFDVVRKKDAQNETGQRKRKSLCGINPSREADTVNGCHFGKTGIIINRNNGIMAVVGSDPNSTGSCQQSVGRRVRSAQIIK